MDTPILTVKQQKQSLSHRKRKSKLTIKNVLANPYSNYWPLLQGEEEDDLKNVLSQHLVIVKAPKARIPYKELIKVPRSERKEFRKSYNDSNSLICGGEEKEQDVIFGINEVTKLLESEKASSILISSEVNPQFMVKHIIDSAIIKKLPVLIMPNLKYLLKDKTGIASAVIAFGNNVSASTYSLIDAKIKEIYCKYRVPLEHPLITRENEINNQRLISVKPDFDSEVEQTDETKGKNLYLYRNSTTERVFKPVLSKLHNSCDMGRGDENFLSLGSNSISQTSKKIRNKATTPKVSYKSLLVKRVINNVNRETGKMEMLKKRKRE